MFSVYILYSNKLGKFYTGTTDDVGSRIQDHNSIAYPNAFTSKGLPWTLFLVIDNLSSHQAISIERHIKRMKSSKYIYDLKKYPELVVKLRHRYM